MVVYSLYVHFDYSLALISRNAVSYTRVPAFCQYVYLNHTV